MSTQDQLLPGDCLLYRPSSVFGWAIAAFTLSKVSHVEIYKGGGISWASRDGIGVNEYSLRTEQLSHVLRATKPLNVGAMAQCFDHLRGHGYDNGTIASFATFGMFKSNVGQEVCSEFATIMFRVGGLKALFSAKMPSEVAPNEFVKSNEFFNSRCA